MTKISIDNEITLELPSLDDAEELFACVEKNREHLRTFLVWVHSSTSVEDSIKNIQDRIDSYTKGTMASFVIKHNGKIIGSSGFVKIKKDQHWGEIGYWIDKEYEGKGIVSKSVKAFLEYGFKELMLHRVLIRCNAKNHRSSAIPKRFGFTHEGTLREDHFDGAEYSNTELFGLLAGEYKIL